MNSLELNTLRQYFQGLNKIQKAVYLQGRTKQEQLFFYRHPELFLFDKQIVPEGDWRYCMLRCGRRFGKTTAGSGWIADKVIKGYQNLGLCGATYSDVVNVMVKNVIKWFPPNECHYVGGEKHYIDFTDGPYKGAKIYCFSSDKEIRGPTMSHLWCDEICNWADQIPEKIQLHFDSVDTAVSEGKHPQTIITSTPKAFPFFFDFQDKVDKGDINYIIRTGTMFDNPNLSDGFRKKELNKYKNKPMQMNQEIYGELVFENPEALFNSQWINDHRFTNPKALTDRDNKCHRQYFWDQVSAGEILIKRGIISVDPAITNGKNSDETGITLQLQDYKNEIYILQDWSGKHSPAAWAKIVMQAFWYYKRLVPAMAIICETNQGGDLVVSNLTAADHNLMSYIKQIKVSKGKLVRAEPVAAKYERGKVHHIGYLDTLERQMCNYTGGASQDSPDRMDAMVHGVNELVMVPQYVKRNTSILSGY